MSNLLIVDDEPGMRQLLTHVFGRGAGHAVRAAENGAKALELLRQEPADLVISDVKMPDMNGIELLRRVREFSPDVAVVLMTAFATVETAREGFKLGADDFMQKPFDVDELKLIVERALEKLALRRENESLRVENEALIKVEREHAGALPDDRDGRRRQLHRPHHRRVGHGQGARGARDPQPQPARRQALR